MDFRGVPPLPGTLVIMKLPGLLVAVPFVALSVASAQSRVLQRYLNKPGFQWTCSALPHIEFCRPAALVSTVAAESSKAVEASLAAQLLWAGASTYSPRIHIFVLESTERMKQLTSAYAFGVSQPADHIVCFVDGHSEDLIHEMNHEVMTTLWGPSEPWIAEGLAAYVAAPQAIDDRFRRLAGSHRDVSPKRYGQRWLDRRVYRLLFRRDLSRTRKLREIPAHPLRHGEATRRLAQRKRRYPAGPRHAIGRAGKRLAGIAGSSVTAGFRRDADERRY
jgi:hypothetical protein